MNHDTRFIYGYLGLKNAQLYSIIDDLDSSHFIDRNNGKREAIDSY